MSSEFVLPESLQPLGRQLLDAVAALELDAPIVLNTPERAALHEAALNSYRLDSHQPPCPISEVAAVIAMQFDDMELADPKRWETFLDVPDLETQLQALLTETEQVWQQQHLFQR